MTTHTDDDPWTDCGCWHCTAQRIIWREGAGNRRQGERRAIGWDFGVNPHNRSGAERRTPHIDKEDQS
jgi:hypothetical protein